MRSQRTIFCTFCGKDKSEANKMIMGPTVNICDDCISLCMCAVMSADAGKVGEADFDFARARDAQMKLGKAQLQGFLVRNFADRTSSHITIGEAAARFYEEVFSAALRIREATTPQYGEMLEE